MLARLSVLGLYNADPSIFDGLVLPEGMENEILIDTIIGECAELSTVYPDPDVFKHMFKSWSRRKLPLWEKMYRTVTAEYNPIENYDRIEEWRDGVHGTSDSRENTNGNSTAAATSYNSDSFKNTDKVTQTNTNTAETTADTETTHTGRVHGNIGVTSAQNMIEQERKIAVYDVYANIVDMFCDDFCVRVYY